MSKVDEKALELSEQLKSDLGAIELQTMEYTLADAIREGAGVTEKAIGWGDGETACAFTAATVAAKARGYIQ